MNRLNIYWIVTACFAALTALVGLALLRQTEPAPIRLSVPTTQPGTFKFNPEIAGEFKVGSEIGPSTAPTTAPAEFTGPFDGDRLLLPTD
jgi:hypothetical protein